MNKNTKQLPNKTSTNWKLSTTIDKIKAKSIWKKLNLDPPLLFAIIVLFFVSFIILYSTNSNAAVIKRHVIRVILSFLIMLVAAQIPTRRLQEYSTWFYLIALIMLLCVLFFGNSAKGAQRWLNFGFVKFQPAEIMKIATPLLVASYFHNHILPPKFKNLIIPTLIIIIPFILISIQPDLGTAILIASTGFFVIFFAGISFKFIGSCIILLITSLPIAWKFLHNYQKKRILTLINPEIDPLGSGYQVIQSKIAIGSGGLYGKGWLNGTQVHLNFLPDQTTDLIFSAFSEEFGFIGIILLLSLYLFIIFRGFHISLRAQDTFSRLIAGSFSMTFFIYLFVNISMVCGILPIVGIPLPLISYGGTSLLTIMISFGILMSIKSSKTLMKK